MTPRIEEKELQFNFIHSSGPGGQNVNKVATAVQLRFNITENKSLPDWIKENLYKKEKKRINREGELIITACRFRSQFRNKQDAMDRLYSILEKASEVAAVRKKTRPGKAIREKRLQNKQFRSKKKLNRKRPEIES